LDFTSTLPARLGTIEGDRGDELSDGQRQRTMIARRIQGNLLIVLGFGRLLQACAVIATVHRLTDAATL
jgi:hypothetical protein